MIIEEAFGDEDDLFDRMTVFGDNDDIRASFISIPDAPHHQSFAGPSENQESRRITKI